MTSEGFYIKKLINPRRLDLNFNPNIIYHKTGKALKNNNEFNIPYQRINNPNSIPISQMNKIPYRNSPVQNGQFMIDINNIKNVNQNLPNYNLNTFNPNEELKLNTEAIPYTTKALPKNYIYNNYMNQKNIKGIIYNTPIINPNLNNPQQIFIRPNIVPVIQIQQIHQPYIPIRRNLMINGFSTPNKNIIRRDLNTQRFNTIQTENRYTLDSIKYIKPLTERKNSNNNSNNNHYLLLENSEFSPKITNNNNNNISTSIKTRATTNLY